MNTEPNRLFAVEIEIGLTGPDWEPTEAIKYYAQVGKHIEFGRTEHEAELRMRVLLRRELKLDD